MFSRRNGFSVATRFGVDLWVQERMEYSFLLNLSTAGNGEEFKWHLCDIGERKSYDGHLCPRSPATLSTFTMTFLR